MFKANFVLFQLVLLVFINTASAINFFPPGVDPDHRIKDPYSKDYNRVSKCLLEKPDGQTLNLSEAAGSYANAYELIAMTPSGRQLLEKFNSEDQKEAYKYVELNQYVRRQMNFPVQIGAAYVFVGSDKTIYFDPQDDLGLLAIFLAHELTHAIDPEVPVSYFEEVDAFKKLPKDEYIKLRQKNSFRIERRAFDMQDKVFAELLTLTPCYKSYIQEQTDTNGLRVFNPTPDSYIRSAYDIPEPAKP